MWTAVSWLSVKDGNVVVVKAARPGRSTWGGWPIFGADSSLDMQPRLEVLFSDDVARHREVSRASSNSKAPPWATKPRSLDFPRRGIISLKPIHNSEMDDAGKCAPVHLGPSGGVLGASGWTRGAQLRK